MSKPLRGLCTRSVEFRAAADENGDGRTLEGYAAVFNQPTEINSWEGHFNETIAPGAFKKTLRDRKPVMQFDHGRDARTGTVPIASIQEAKEDGNGLKVKARMFDNPVVEPIRQAIEGGAINGMSFRFEPVRDEWRDAKGGEVQPEELYDLLYGGRAADPKRLPLQRTIREVKLYEMGPVVNPAYVGTTVGVRSMDDLSDDEVDRLRQELVAEYQRTMVRSEDPEEPNEPEGAPEGTEPAAEEREDEPVVEPEVEDAGPDDEFGEDGLPVERAMDTGNAGAAIGNGKAKKKSGKDPKKPYGEVEYADPGYQKDGKARYPLDTKKHVTAAWDYINKASNQKPYTADQLSKIMSKIKAAAKKFGIEISDNDGDEKKSAETSGAAREGTPESKTPKDAALPGTSERETNPSSNDSQKETKVKTKAEIEARQAEIDARLAEFAGFGERSLDEKEQTEYDGLVTERQGNDDELKKISARQEFLKGLAKKDGNTESGSDRSAPSFHKEVDPYDLGAIRSAAVSEEDLERRYREAALRAADTAKYARAPHGYRGEASGDRVTRLLDEIDNPDLLAKRMLLTGSAVYERAFSKLLKYGSADMCDLEERQALIRAQSLGTDSAGGYAVPFQLDPTVMLTNSGTQNPIRDLARVETITGKQWQGVTSAGVTVTRGSEAATASDNSFTLAQVPVNTNRVQGFIPFSYEVDLAWGALRSTITELLVDGKAREEGSFITGDGVTGVQPGGIVGSLNSSQNVNTATAGVFALADVYALQAALPVRFENNSSWLAHKAVYHKIRQFDTAGGAGLWARVGEGQPPRLLDYPDYRSSDMVSDYTTAANRFLLYGDFKQFLIVDRLGMNVELIPQLFDASNGNRPTGQRGVYAIWMNNSAILAKQAFQILTQH